MTELSPAAQAVLDTFLNGSITAPVLRVAFNADRYGLAAALRALATRGEAMEIRTASGFAEIDEMIRVSDIYAIADELEAR